MKMKHEIRHESTPCARTESVGQESQPSPFNAIIIPTLLGAIAGSKKFQFKYSEWKESKEFNCGWIETIEIKLDWTESFEGKKEYPILFSRSVDSMTDAELMSFGTSYDEDELDEARIHVSFTRNVDDVLQMLSMGVLPKYIADLLPMKVDWV